MLGADESDLAVAIAAVFGSITDPRAQLRAVREGRSILARVAGNAVANCRRAGISWRDIGQELGEAHATAYRHYDKLEPVQEVVVGAPGGDGDEPGGAP